MSECKRVLQVVTIMNRGGIENMLMNLYRNIDREKIQFDFVVHRSQKAAFDDEIRALGGKIYYAPQYKCLNHFSYVTWWENFFKEHPEYKIIHSHTYSLASVQHKIAKKYGLITIVHSHSTSTPKSFKGKVQRAFQKNITNISDYLFACSSAAGEWLYGKGCEKRKNYVLLKNAIDAKKYVFDELIRSEVRNELNISGKFVVGHVGSFGIPKNHIYLLEILKKISLKREDSVLLLVGDGALRPQIEEKIKELGIEDRVVMTGIRPDVNKLMQAMDCFVFPSIYEGLPVTVIEAQAAGLQCFISDRITDEVCITDSVERLSIEDSPVVWCEKILNNEKTGTRAENKAKIIATGYDVEETSKWLTDFYSKIMHRN